MSDIPAHQQRKTPSMGDWIDALLFHGTCPDCGERLLHRKNVEYDHNPPLADRIGDRWLGIHTEDPRFIEIRHINCHQQKTNREHTARWKAKRIGAKHEEHLAKIQAFPLPAPTKSKFKKKWASRSFPKRSKKSG
ncbi:MAG: hypothetical protein GY938_24480 [Ketobacter sp.]|nr:hypothetical protein [Ketobacter sp.]